MSQLRKVEILLTNGYKDRLTNVHSMKRDGDWIYVYLPEEVEVTYRAERVTRIESFPMYHEKASK